MAKIMIVAFLSLVGFTGVSSANAAENCRDEIRKVVLASASALTPGTTVTDFKNLRATGKTVLTKSGETLREYSLTDLMTEDGWIPGSSASVYVKGDALSCLVVRIAINLR